MGRIVGLFILTSLVGAGVGQSAPKANAPRKAGSACKLLTAEMLSKPVTLADGCYRVEQFTNVGSALTVSPGATIVFGAGATLSVESNGSIEAVGTAEKPIVLRGKEQTAGFWRGISIASRSAHNRFDYVTVQGAGEKSSDDAAILLAPGSQLGLDHTTVSKSLGTGVLVMDNAAFSHFAANRFTHTDVPLRIKASDVAMMDAATTFAENTNNVVVIPFGEGKVDENVLWRKLAVPYRFEASVEVDGRLTVEAGAELQFRANLLLNVVQNGSLTAIGSEADPVIFTGTDETAGYWSGVFFESPSLKNILRNVEVRFGGAKDGPVGGGVGITHGAAAVVQSSTFKSCPTGIFVASEGTLNADAASSNRFEAVGRNIFREP